MCLLELLKDSFSYEFFAARNNVGFVLIFYVIKSWAGISNFETFSSNIPKINIIVMHYFISWLNRVNYSVAEPL